MRLKNGNGGITPAFSGSRPLFPVISVILIHQNLEFEEITVQHINYSDLKLEYNELGDKSNDIVIADS